MEDYLISDKLKRSFEIPKNIAEFISSNHGINLSVEFNNTDGINSYGSIIHHIVRISMLNKRCINCGYSTLWHPELWETSKCGRHTYGYRDYDDVFVWSDKNELSLEQAFDDWLSKQSRCWIDGIGMPEPIKFEIYGPIGLR